MFSVMTRYGQSGRQRVLVYAIAGGCAAILALFLTRRLWHILPREDFGVW